MPRLVAEKSHYYPTPCTAQWGEGGAGSAALKSYEEFHTLPAAKGADGKYNMHGNLVVAGVEAQKKLFDLLEPIIEATRGTKTIIMAPVVRYITKGCCDDPDRMPNGMQDGFEKGRKEVGILKNRLKDHLFAAGHVHCRVLDPAMDMANKVPTEIWGDDPTIPAPAIFDSMVAAALAGAKARIDLSKKRPGEKLASVAKKPRVEKAVAATVPGQNRGGGPRGGGGSENGHRGSRRGSGNNNPNLGTNRGHSTTGRRFRGRGGRGRGGGNGGNGGSSGYDYNQAEAENWWHGDWYGRGRWNGGWRSFGGGARGRSSASGRGRGGGRGGWRY
jgi:hypothetical protein